MFKTYKAVKVNNLEVGRERVLLDFFRHNVVCGRNDVAIDATKVPKKLRNTRIFVALFPKSANQWVAASGFKGCERQAIAQRQYGYSVDSRMLGEIAVESAYCLGLRVVCRGVGHLAVP